jgi:hypothetical protein
MTAKWALGQSRQYDDVRIRSGYYLEAAQERNFDHFAFGPEPEFSICRDMTVQRQKETLLAR